MDRAKKIVFLILTAILWLNAEQVEITSDKFFADENKHTTEFKGNVHIKKGNDELKADTIVVNFDKKRQPIKYTATNNINFKLFIKDKHYEGSGDILIYEPLKELYTISKNAHLKEIQTNKNVYGDKIVIDQKNGIYNVNSSNKQPVKFIFEVGDKKN